MFCIAICTYNRSNILQLTLPVLEKYWDDEIELLLIDNGSTDNTKKVFKEMNLSNARYVFEPNIGLSFARNRAIQESKSNWIFFLDDDAKVLSNTITKAKYLVQEYNYFGIIGGTYIPWYATEKPKWLPDEFGFFITEFDSFKQITSLSDGLPVGGILLYNKYKMKDLSAFQSNLGMKGNNLGYGEETDLAIRAIKNGIKVGLDPMWKIEHLVASYKFKLSWQLKAIISHGKADEMIQNSNIMFRFYTFFKSIGGMVIKKIPLNLVKLINTKTYYWQNFILDTLRSTLYLWGRLSK